MGFQERIKRVSATLIERGSGAWHRILPLLNRLLHHRATPVVAGVLTGIAIITWLAFGVWNRPLDRSLESSEHLIANYLPSARYPTPSVPQPASHRDSSTGELLPTPRPLCGGPIAMHLLLIGNDSKQSDYHSTSGFADVIRLVRVDFGKPGVTILSIPRDLWVPIPGLESVTGISANRLKTAYAYGNRYLGEGGGPILMAETLAVNFGVYLDRYFVVSFDAFADGIDTIGGIDIYLEDTIADEVGLEPGWNHLDGEATLQYAYLRPENSSDLYRIDRQSQIIRALVDRLLTPQVMASAPRLTRSLRQSVLTDLSPADISMLLCLADYLQGDDISLLDLDPALFETVIDGYGYQRLIPDSQGITGAIIRFQSGEEITLGNPE
nr:LCP family protein [Anaerolineae bacterium]